MTNDDEGICLVEKILNILQKNNIENNKAFLITNHITRLLSRSFDFKSTDIDLAVSNVTVVSDNSNLNTYINVGDKKERINNVSFVRWELNANDERGKLTLELMGIGD